MKKSNVLIVIVTYNATRYDWLTKCISSVQNSSTQCDIIVIDNNSTDETCDIIKQKYVDVYLVENKMNTGFGSANNIGLQYALDNGYEYIFLLNQDAFLERDTVEKLIKTSKENQDYGIISPLHLSGDGESLDAEFSREIMHKYCPFLISDLILKKYKEKIYEAEFICAAAWLIPIRTLQLVGGFNPSFFHYGEDNNYVHRLQFKKLKTGVYPHAVIYHDREDRLPSSFESKEYVSKRNYLINVSNPNNTLTTNDLKKHLIISLLKSVLTFKPKEAKHTIQEIKFFNQQKLTLDRNLEISKINSYAFLKGAIK